MSRIGKKTVALPKGVTVTLNGQTVSVKGPKGESNIRRNVTKSERYKNGSVHDFSL